MQTKSLIHIGLTATIFVNLLFAGCSHMENVDVKDSILEYENYPLDSIVLPDKYSENWSEVPFAGNLNEKELQSVQENQITGELFDILCHSVVINRWDFHCEFDSLNRLDGFYLYQYSNYNEYVDQKKKELKLYHLGKVRLSKSFDSFLIYEPSHLNDNAYFTLKTVFLVNVVNNAVTSITRVYVYSGFDSQSDCIYTERRGKNTFIQRDKNISYDVILPEGMEPERTEFIVKFAYDKQGKLKIRRLVKKEYPARYSREIV